ncbi:MFS transporter, partial [Staphylococcus epidermidis]
QCKMYLGHVKVLLGMFLSLKTLYRKRTVIWPFYFYTIIRTLSFKIVGLTVCLFMFGLGGVIGNLITGNLPEDKLTKNLYLTFLLLFVTIILFVTVIQNSILALIICFLFGFGTFGTTPLLNSKIILSAKEAPLLASTLAASIFNVANFLGAIIGSILLSIGLPYIQITLISGGIIVLGMLLNLVNQLYEKKHITFNEYS